MKFRIIEGTWKDSVGGCIAGVCSILGVLASFGYSKIPELALLLIPATLLIPKYVFTITWEKDEIV